MTKRVAKVKERTVSFDLTINLNSGAEIDLDGVSPNIESLGTVVLKMIDGSKDMWKRGEFPTSLLIAVVP